MSKSTPNYERHFPPAWITNIYAYTCVYTYGHIHSRRKVTINIWFVQIFTQKKRKMLNFAPNWSVFVILLHYHMVNLARFRALEQEKIIALGRRRNDVGFIIRLRAMTTT